MNHGRDVQAVERRVRSYQFVLSILLLHHTPEICPDSHPTPMLPSQYQQTFKKKKFIKIKSTQEEGQRNKIRTTIDSYPITIFFHPQRFLRYHLPTAFECYSLTLLTQKKSRQLCFNNEKPIVIVIVIVVKSGGSCSDSNFNTNENNIVVVEQGGGDQWWEQDAVLYQGGFEERAVDARRGRALVQLHQ